MRRSRDRLAAQSTPEDHGATSAWEAPITVYPACINKGAWTSAKTRKWAWDSIQWLQRMAPHAESWNTVLRARKPFGSRT